MITVMYSSDEMRTSRNVGCRPVGFVIPLNDNFHADPEALLAHRLSEGNVFSVDIDPELVWWASNRKAAITMTSHALGGP